MADPSRHRWENPRPSLSGFAQGVGTALNNALANTISSATRIFSDPNAKGLPNAASQFLGKFDLVSTQRAHETTRAFDDEVRRLVESGVYPNGPPGSAVAYPTARHLRTTQFGSFTVWADDRQGECLWNVFPTLWVSELDESLLQFHDLAGAGLTNSQAVRLDFCDRHMILKNQAPSKAEISVWLLWPREDLPNDRFDEAYFCQYDFKTPAVITFPYTVNEGIPRAASGFNTSAEWKGTSALLSNDWNATPYENPWLQNFFNIEFKGDWQMMPGDEIEFSWGQQRSQIAYPWKDLLLSFDSTELKNAYPYFTNYSLMRRCGPLVLFRTRGRLSHDESKQAGSPGASPNFGLFNLEYALITKRSLRPLSLFWDYADSFRGTIPSSSDPTTVNQATAANTTQWFVQPSNEANPNPGP